MSDDAPYRASRADRCSRCATPLPSAENRQPRVCDRGCGEWLALAAVDEHLCPEMLSRDGGGMWWKPAPEAPPCPACGQAMTYVAAGESMYFRCPQHGLWFDKQRRAQVIRDFASEVSQHRRLREIVALLKRGDDESLRSLARIILNLDAQISELRREVARQ